MNSLEYVLATLTIESKNAIEEADKAEARLSEARAASEKAWACFMKSDPDDAQLAMKRFRECKSREKVDNMEYHYQRGRKQAIMELERLIRPEIERALG